MSPNSSFYNTLPQIVEESVNLKEWHPIVPPGYHTQAREEPNEQPLPLSKHQSVFPSSLYDTLSQIKKPTFPQSSNFYLNVLLLTELCSCNANDSLITHDVIEEVFLENLRRDLVAPAEDDCEITWFRWGRVLDVRRQKIKFWRLAQRVREEFDDETATRALRLIAGRVLLLFNSMMKRRFYAERGLDVRDGALNYQETVMIDDSVKAMTLVDLEDCIMHLGEKAETFEVDWLLEYGVVPQEKDSQEKKPQEEQPGFLDTSGAVGACEAEPFETETYDPEPYETEPSELELGILAVRRYMLRRMIMGNAKRMTVRRSVAAPGDRPLCPSPLRQSSSLSSSPP
ncbi:hypothetical protein GGR53DRAFT_462689 [Hypoxylon sp. FL1150]|nr:hypothetical protein GGR53DRAFT_462689 [Hypoxylon sp. FL1150]